MASTSGANSGEGEPEPLQHPPAEDSEPVDPPPTSREAEPAPVLKLPAALHALAWSTGAAVFLGLATSLGMARTNGVYGALGLTALTPPAIDQSQTIFGVFITLQIILMCIAISVIGRGLYLGSQWGIRNLSRREIPALPQRIRQRLWWFAIALLIADAVLVNAGIMELAKSAENLLFKSTSEIGDIWTHVVFEDDHSTVTNYDLLFYLSVTVFVWLSWWLAKYRFKWLVPRIAFTTYAVAQVAGMMLGFAHLHGIAGTVEDYPVVAFSGVTEIGQHVLPFLLGQDDKTFAILILQLSNQNDSVQTRYVLYLPRTELKWMTVLKFMPLYQMSKIDDLKKLAEQVQKSSQ
jgi:hypothetical protein